MKMKTTLSYFLLISIPALISSDFTITEVDHHKNDDVRPWSKGLPLSQRTLKKRSTMDHRAKPLRELEIYSMKINSKVTSRYAHNVITSRVANRANVSKEAFFEIELPKTAFITNFSMTLDGTTYVGAVKEKETAHQQYQHAVSKGQTAGIVKESGRNMEKFDVSVNIGSGKKVTFELTYEELLKRNLGKYKMNIQVNPKQLVNDFQIDVHIFEPQGISFLDVDAKFLVSNLTSVVNKTLTKTKAHVSFKPTLEQQRKCQDCQDTVLDGDFIIRYDVHRDMSAGSIQVVNGYFVHHFAPVNLTRIPKNVVFVIDHSGSMSGIKMQQTNEALLKILDDMDKKDHFAITIFDDTYEIWKNSLIQASPEHVAEAKVFVQTILAEGATNINDPMLEAVKLLDRSHQEKQLPERSVSMIILLTDGDPNTGESNPQNIQKNVKKAVNGKYNVYTLGFGFDVKFSFLEKMALDNNGVARRIYEDSDASLQLQGFYDEVANPLLLDIELQYPENAISELTRASFRQYYDGSEIVVAGRISDKALESLTTKVVAQTANENLTLKADVNIPETESYIQQQQYIFGDFTERLWAYLTIQQLLEKRISLDIGRKRLTKRILDLALKYNFVTSLTSMVVTKPEESNVETLVADKPSEDERKRKPWQNKKRIDWNKHRAPSSHIPHPLPHLFTPQVGYMLMENPMHSMGKGFDLRHRSSVSMTMPIMYDLVDIYPSPTMMTDVPHLIPHHYNLTIVDSDPHFITSVNNHKDTVCFNIDGKPNVILNLIMDPYTGFVVNGQLIGDKKIVKNKKLSTYFGKFGIMNSNMDVKIEVSTQEITVFHGEDKMIFPWSATTSLTKESFSISIMKERNLTLTMGDDATFVIVLHRVWKYHPLHRDFLGFYTLDSHRFSNITHGLLGQFYHEVKAEIYNIRPGLDQGKPDATMIINGHKLRVTRGYQKDYRFDPKRGNNISCWFIHNNGKGFIAGTPTDYIVSSLFVPLYPLPVIT
ncbi:inter-alpha-trypsin inhibitor heavy chain H3-like isoform X2 [Narcine bancroftii]|uniref:inter-alpha-trypsin inhibitor heavy chain H3-like isoform X2 n=1 Tax=Narcine bancroftii TaxID=1343680 RepID=UPI0038322C87